MQILTVLGSTGSIGVNALDIVSQHPDRFKIFALSCHTRVADLAAQSRVAIMKNIEDIAKNTEDVKNLWTVNGDRKNETEANAAAITDLENNKVELAEGQSMLTIWRGSTDDYDSITHDPDTLYIVTP